MQFRGEEKLVNDFKQMQIEMRTVMQNNKLPDRVPLKLKQHAMLPNQGFLVQKTFNIEESMT